jgi:effector-binding domain-containing protein
MLRHYDELDLLKPAHIDHNSGYRFYTAEQLPRLNRILALQDLGFSLRQIGELLKKEPPVEQMQGMLLQKQAELEDQMRGEQERLARVAARLRLIESRDTRHDILVKDVPAQWVASVRDTISAYNTVGYLFGRLFAHVVPLGAQGLAGVVWHDDSHVETGIDAEGLIYLSSPISGSADVKVYELPAAKMATVVHHGSYLTLNSAYDALVRWLDGSGYAMAGPNRELYLHFTQPPRQDDETYVTEIQFPITK